MRVLAAQRDQIERRACDLDWLLGADEIAATFPAQPGLLRAAAVAFVLAYFTLPKLEFIRRYFAQRRDMLERATTEESYRRIVEDLKHPIQQRLVAEKPDSNRLILAGPGSGKTRAIVHRVAYLMRVLREASQKLLVLAFTRCRRGRPAEADTGSGRACPGGSTRGQTSPSYRLERSGSLASKAVPTR